jgi:hypothetical protein
LWLRLVPSGGLRKRLKRSSLVLAQKAGKAVAVCVGNRVAFPSSRPRPLPAGNSELMEPAASQPSQDR